MIRRIVQAIVYASVLTAAISIGALLSLRVATSARGTVEVPNLYNTSLEQALDQLAERDLELHKAESRYSAVIPQHHVISQDPLPGTTVRRGRPVRVVISKGQEYDNVPNVIGRTLRAGRIMLRKDGFQSGRISWVPHRSPENEIIAQAPPAGAPGVRNSKIDLLVSLGPRKRVYRMPKLTGRSIDETRNALNTLGLELGELDTRIDPTLPQGQVLEQKPEPGTRIVEGDEVSLVMSIPSEVGRAAQTNFGAVIFRTSPGFFKRQIRIELIDPLGSREIYRQMHLPASEVTVPYTYHVPATVKVYQDDRLVLERTHE